MKQSHLNFGDYEYRARNTDPITSHLAAAQAGEFANAHIGIIFDTLTRCGPMGGTDIAKNSGRLTQFQVCRQLKPMRDKGLIEDSGETSRTPSGRLQIIWRIKPEEPARV